MKIDFNGREMTIKFDKVPKFLYFNEEGFGCGQVYLYGQRIKKLCSVAVNAHTKDDKGVHPIEYKIKYCEERLGYKTISTMKDGLEITIKIADMPMFKQILDVIISMSTDESISEEKRQQYIDRFISAINPNFVLYNGNGNIVDFVMEEKQL